MIYDYMAKAITGITILQKYIDIEDDNYYFVADCNIILIGPCENISKTDIKRLKDAGWCLEGKTDWMFSVKGS